MNAQSSTQLYIFYQEFGKSQCSGIVLYTYILDPCMHTSSTNSSNLQNLAKYEYHRELLTCGKLYIGLSRSCFRYNRCTSDYLKFINPTRSPSLGSSFLLGYNKGVHTTCLRSAGRRVASRCLQKRAFARSLARPSFSLARPSVRPSVRPPVRVRPSIERATFEQHAPRPSVRPSVRSRPSAPCSTLAT